MNFRSHIWIHTQFHWFPAQAAYRLHNTHRKKKVWNGFLNQTAMMKETR
jgi:uncharacterized cysteine cluster protein YcgN (CxxCxxCC family)